MQPGWKNATCACGTNIWDDGGDPDWGACYECMVSNSREEHSPPEQYEEHVAQAYEGYLADQLATDPSTDSIEE